jgi:glycerol kinase
MKPDLVIGIDQSTTATKAIAFDRRGTDRGRRPRRRAALQSEDGLVRGRGLGLDRLPRHGAQAADQEDFQADRIAAVSISNQRESFAQFDAKRERRCAPARCGSTSAPMSR